jgi:uncharacterized membrane protein YjfL (UPF0719 family)
MTPDALTSSGIYLVASFVLFMIGKLVYDWTTPSYSIKEELVEKDNAALGLSLVGYYLGLVVAIGGVMAGPSMGLEEDLIDLGIFGLISIVLMNLSRVINDRLILHQFRVRDELIRDQNLGTGAVVFASYLATGLVVHGSVKGIALLGAGMTVTSTLVFWGLGQLALVFAGMVYNRITPYDLHAQIMRNNVAAGVGFGGALIGIGNVVRFAVEGDFLSWGMSLQTFAIELAAGLILLPIVRVVTDKVLLPGRSLSDEISQEKPNLAAGFVEAFSYIAASLLIVWSL